MFLVIVQHKQYMVTSIWYICMKEDIECIYLFIYYPLFKVGNRIQQQANNNENLKITMLAVSQRDALIYTNYI